MWSETVAAIPHRSRTSWTTRSPAARPASTAAGEIRGAEGGRGTSGSWYPDGASPAGSVVSVVGDGEPDGGLDVAGLVAAGRGVAAFGGEPEPAPFGAGTGRGGEH